MNRLRWLLDGSGVNKSDHWARQANEQLLGLAIMNNYYMVNHQTANAYGESNNLSEMAHRMIVA